MSTVEKIDVARGLDARFSSSGQGNSDANHTNHSKEQLPCQIGRASFKRLYSKRLDLPECEALSVRSPAVQHSGFPPTICSQRSRKPAISGALPCTARTNRRMERKGTLLSHPPIELP